MIIPQVGTWVPYDAQGVTQGKADFEITESRRLGLDLKSLWFVCLLLCIYKSHFFFFFRPIQPTTLAVTIAV